LEEAQVEIIHRGDDMVKDIALDFFISEPLGGAGETVNFDGYAVVCWL